jgi:hypothetical protein
LSPERLSKAPNGSNGLERVVLSLDEHAKRCPVASESIDPDNPVRVGLTN